MKQNKRVEKKTDVMKKYGLKIRKQKLKNS